MIETRLNDFDLNLLKIFAEIYQTKSLTQAAKRLGMTQPGVSRALQRMREQLNDPLFVRTGSTLAPTSRAITIGDSLPQLLKTMADQCFPIIDFKPEEFQGKINIMVSGTLIDALGTVVITTLNTLCPNALVQLTHWSQGSLAAMEQEDIVLGINYFPLSINQNIRQISVVADRPVCLMREYHPLQDTQLTPEVLSTVDLCGMVIPELSEYQTMISSHFKNMGFQFKLRSDHLPSLYQRVEQSDLLMFTLDLATRNRPKGIKLIPIDWQVNAPELSIALYFHQRNSSHPIYIWLVNTIKQLILNYKAAGD